MSGNVVGFITFDFVLGIICRSMMRVSLVLKIGSMHFYDFTGHMAGF